VESAGLLGKLFAISDASTFPYSLFSRVWHDFMLGMDALVWLFMDYRCKDHFYYFKDQNR
jgi:hypothetical protein